MRLNWLLLSEEGEHATAQNNSCAQEFSGALPLIRLKPERHKRLLLKGQAKWAVVAAQGQATFRC
jgi:hypothetical protein